MFGHFKAKFDTSGTPSEIYNARLWYCLFIFGIFGSARGYDEGLISAVTSQTSFINRFNLEDPNKTESELDNLISNIKAMVQLGSIGGALLGGYTNDKLGRKLALQVACFFWIIFVIIQMTSKTVGQLYAGRLLEGLVVGQTVVIGPTYLSEVSPAKIRGLANGIFSGAVYFGIMLAYCCNLGTALHMSDSNEAQWIVPTSVKIMLAAVVGIGSIFCYESPRWLVKVGRTKEALANLSKIRHLPEDHPYVIGELNDVYEQLNQEKEAVKGSSIISLLKELFMTKSNAWRLSLALTAQALAQWSGASALTIYTSTVFSLLGIEGKIKKFVYTAILGIVKFVAAYLSAFLIIDLLGRRRSLYIGMTAQAMCMLYIAIYMKIYQDLAAKDEIPHHSASEASLAMVYLSGASWAVGWNSFQYLFGSEIFPLRLRSIANSIIMMFHFCNQYGNSKANPYMLDAMDNWGTFLFYAALLVFSLAWVFFFIPELTNRSLESMDELFSLPWYLIGRRGAQLAPDHTTIQAYTHHELRDGEDFTPKDWDDKAGNVEYVEQRDKEYEELQEKKSSTSKA